MSIKWLGAAAWSAREAHAGDRLPYARLVDEQTLMLRDGSLMSALQVPGLLFETEDTEALNQHAMTREVMLRSNLDARFVMYHHVIRRRVSVELAAQVDDPLARGLPLGRREALADDHLERQPQQSVEQARRGRVGIVLEAEHGGEIGLARAAQLHRVEPEARPAIGNHATEVGVVRRAAHGPHLAVVERA